MSMRMHEEIGGFFYDYSSHCSKQHMKGLFHVCLNEIKSLQKWQNDLEYF